MSHPPPGADRPAVLVVTNDFPPDVGGIQRFADQIVRGLAALLPPGGVVVHAARARDVAAQTLLDAELAAAGVTVVRDPAHTLLPTPAVAARVAATARRHRCGSVWFVAAAPLGLLAPSLRRAGVRRIVATTHGHEVWWSRVPGARGLLRRVASGVDVLTHLTDATRDAMTPALAGARRRPQRVSLTPGVDSVAFAPTADGAAVRARHLLQGRPVVVCVSRLVARKGADRLVAALPAIRARVGDVALLVVGDGPARGRVLRAAARAGLAVGDGGDVVLAGSVPAAELAAHYAAGDVFAMAAHDRLAGLETEGLGICYLEAAACGLPVVAGRSGGTPEALVDSVTGLLVDARDPAALAGALGDLLTDPARAAAFGVAGRDWVVHQWAWPERARQLAALLEVGAPAAGSVPTAVSAPVEGPDGGAGRGHAWTVRRRPSSTYRHPRLWSWR